MDYKQLEDLQKLPLHYKVMISQQRITEWYEHWEGKVYVSFSGGKDSTVLLHIARGLYPDIPAVFCDTGLEYPEIREFVKTISNVTWIKPSMNFKKVIEKYGYPVISKEQSRYIQEWRTTKSKKLKHKRWNGDKAGNFKISEKWKFLVDAPFMVSDKCCHIMKKQPFHKYEKETGSKAILGTRASESRLRYHTYLNNNGCNAFSLSKPTSSPLGFWMEQDVLKYLKDNQIPLAKCYGDITFKDDFNKLKLLKSEDLITSGVDRTGCMFCMFGIHLQSEPNKFQRMKVTHPKQYDYCMNVLGLKKVLDYIGEKY